MNKLTIALCLGLAPSFAFADPMMECSIDSSSQVEIADCVAETEARADAALETALGFARASATDLDQATGRDVALRALEAAQSAWAAYRDAQCEAIGAGYGGGSGTGIAIRSCRVDLSRERTAALLGMIN